MRLATFLSVMMVLMTAYVMAVAPMKRIIVSYPNETPQKVVDEAMEEIVKAGGKITHVYNIIKGFSADAPVTVLEKVETMDAEHRAVIEEDGVVTTQDN